MGAKCQRFLEILAKIPLFLWSVKSLVLVPWDIYTDVNLAITHFNNGHMLWGGLTVTFLLPSLMFPYHYFHIIKFAVAKFRFLFKSSSPSQNDKWDIKKKERWIICLDAILAYFEDIPQFILQVYILWKTPVECFSLDGDMNSDELSAIQSILTSLISISVTVVPFYIKTGGWEPGKVDELLYCDGIFSFISGIFSFISGTFFNVIPKLVLMSWLFSVLNCYMWLFVIPVFFISMCISFNIMTMKDWMDEKWSGNRWQFDGISKKDFRVQYLGNRLMASIQVMFGYHGLVGTIVSTLIMACFLITLAINLHAAVHTSEQVDYFSVFPSDPFPSRTICFTNSSLIEQQEIWNNETTTFSNNCNMTYSAVLCDQGVEGGQRGTIVVQLALMISMVSSLLVAAVIVPCMCLFISMYIAINEKD